MLIVDGARYKSWTPKDEEKEFHPLVKAQSKEIFGRDSIYFDVKTTLKSASGIGSIPDAYVIDLAEPYQWYVIENELATHPVYDHIVKQLTKFINGIDNQNSRIQILELLYNEINRDNNLRATILTKTKSVDVYRFLTRLFSKSPKIVVIIDQKTPDVEEACQALKYAPEIIEFKTFEQEHNPGNYAHLFDPLYIVNTDETGNEQITLKEKEPKIVRPEEANNNIIDIYQKIEATMYELDSKISVNQTKAYISLRLKRIFAYIHIRKTKIHIIVMLPPKVASNFIRKHQIRQIPQRSQQYWGGPSFQVTIDNDQSLEEIFKVLEEAYKQQI
jgi:predicted transport protein